MQTHSGVDKFRVVITRLANGAPTQTAVRLAVEYHCVKGTPVFVRAWDEKGRCLNLKDFDQTQLFEAYDKHRLGLP